ncbi:MAG: hypothetical protein Q7S59_05895 [Sulfurimonas sp.]|nr:hypothetical protein [Sulfurimonas sp.]
MLTYRKDLTRPLTAEEVDENFIYLKSEINIAFGGTQHVNIPIALGSFTKVSFDVFKIFINNEVNANFYINYNRKIVGTGAMPPISYINSGAHVVILDNIVTITPYPDSLLFDVLYDNLTQTAIFNQKPFVVPDNAPSILYSFDTDGRFSIPLLPVDNTPIYS